jgi:hypothetical protein
MSTSEVQEFFVTNVIAQTANDLIGPATSALIPEVTSER